MQHKSTRKQRAIKIPPCPKCGSAVVLWSGVRLCPQCDPVARVLGSGLPFLGEVKADRRSYVIG